MFIFYKNVVNPTRRKELRDEFLKNYHLLAKLYDKGRIVTLYLDGIVTTKGVNSYNGNVETTFAKIQKDSISSNLWVMWTRSKGRVFFLRGMLTNPPNLP